MSRDMSDDSNPSVLEQPADAPLAQPTVHELSVAPEYAVGSPVFAAPALTQVHVLSVESYITGKLGWSSVAIMPYRLHWGSAGGHPYTVSPKIAAKLLPLVEQYIVENQPAHDLKILGTTTQLVKYARKLAEAEGVTAVADSTLIRYLTRPAVRNIRLRAAAEKSDVN